MYTQEQLSRYPFFAEVIDSHSLSGVLDSLTGLVSRPYMIEFVRRMIRAETPFSFALLDLDNFKFINDTYGHQIGDGVLEHVGADLIDYVGDKGVVGRYGGDEFLIINFADRTYAGKKQFFEGMYSNYRVLRKNPSLGYCEPFVTGTVGCATFPDDAQDYNHLFDLIDKTLYRGKSKGRNCYIIYVEEKHRDIEIKKLAGHGLYTTFHNISEQFDLIEHLDEKLHLAFMTLKDDLRVSDLYYVGQAKILRSVSDANLAWDVSGIDELMAGDLYPTNNPEDMKEVCPSLYAFLKEREIASAVLVRIGMQKETYGYLMCAEPNVMRLWQEDDCAMLFYLAREIAWFMWATGAALE